MLILRNYTSKLTTVEVVYSSSRILLQNYEIHFVVSPLFSNQLMPMISVLRVNVHSYSQSDNSLFYSLGVKFKS